MMKHRVKKLSLEQQSLLVPTKVTQILTWLKGYMIMLLIFGLCLAHLFLVMVGLPEAYLLAVF